MNFPQPENKIFAPGEIRLLCVSINFETDHAALIDCAIRSSWMYTSLADPTFRFAGHLGNNATIFLETWTGDYLFPCQTSRPVNCRQTTPA